MTTPDRPVGGSAGPADEGVVRVFPGPPPPPSSGPPPVTTVGTPGTAATPPPGPTSGSPTSGSPTADEASSAAGDVKDQAASRASDVKDTAAQQAGQVKDTAAQQAGQVKDSAASAASDVAATTREQVQNVVGEASSQARQVADNLTSQLNQQAGTQQQRAAGGLRSLAEGVSDMAEGRGAPSGPVGDLTRQAADRLHTAAGYLENRQPPDLLDDVRSFAARRPAAFLLGAAVAGFAVGRLVKGASGSGSSGAGAGSPASSATGQPGIAGARPVGAARVATPPAPPPVPAPEPAVVTPVAPTRPAGADLVDEPYPTDDVYGEPHPARDVAIGPDERIPLTEEFPGPSGVDRGV